MTGKLVSILLVSCELSLPSKSCLGILKFLSCINNSMTRTSLRVSTERPEYEHSGQSSVTRRNKKVNRVYEHDLQTLATLFMLCCVMWAENQECQCPHSRLHSINSLFRESINTVSIESIYNVSTLYQHWNQYREPFSWNVQLFFLKLTKNRKQHHWEQSRNTVNCPEQSQQFEQRILTVSTEYQQCDHSVNTVNTVFTLWSVQCPEYKLCEQRTDSLNVITESTEYQHCGHSLNSVNT